MALITFNIAAFRVSFPEFESVVTYPNALLQGYFDAATCFVSNSDYGRLQGDCRVRALDLMTAHLVKLGTIMATGQTPSGVTTAATVGAVSVTNLAPPVKGMFQFWLASTPYGLQLMALLGVKGAGGLYVGGLPETRALRKVGGFF